MLSRHVRTLTTQVQQEIYVFHPTDYISGLETAMQKGLNTAAAAAEYGLNLYGLACSALQSESLNM